MACFRVGLCPLVPGQGEVPGVHGLPLNSSWTAWIPGGPPGLPGCPVRVHTSWAAIWWRATESALAAAPVRLTVAVVPSTVTLMSLALECGGNAVMAGGVGLPWLCSHTGCGLASSAVTRFVARDVDDVPVGTKTASGTSTCPIESKKYRSCGL